MDDEKLAAGGLIGAVVLAVVGAIYVVCNLVQCQEQWHWSGRAYEPAYTWYSNDCVYYNKNGTCRVTIPVQHNEPEKYAWLFTDCLGAQNKRYVSAAEYPGQGGVWSVQCNRWKRCPCNGTVGY